MHEPVITQQSELYNTGKTEIRYIDWKNEIEYTATVRSILEKEGDIIKPEIVVVIHNIRTPEYVIKQLVKQAYNLVGDK